MFHLRPIKSQTSRRVKKDFLSAISGLKQELVKWVFNYLPHFTHVKKELSFNKLKGHGNEADFLGFLQKLGPHRSLTLPFEPFRFWLRIRGDIHNRQTTPRLTKSGSRLLSDSASRGVADSPTRRVGESTTHRLAESGSRLLNV
jgi:hypothetical protein